MLKVMLQFYRVQIHECLDVMIFDNLKKEKRKKKKNIPDLNIIGFLG